MATRKTTRSRTTSATPRRRRRRLELSPEITDVIACLAGYIEDEPAGASDLFQRLVAGEIEILGTSYDGEWFRVHTAPRRSDYREALA